MRRRFSVTASGASPTWPPTFSESNGGALTPPVRSVKAARTRAGAGQFGLMRSTSSTALVRFEHGHQALHIGRQRRLPLDILARDRMHELQARRVQSLAFEAAELGSQLRRAPRGDATTTTINRIPDERITDVREVHPDLMRAARFEFRAQQRVRAEAPHDAIMSNGRTPVGAHGHAGALAAVAPNGLIDRATARHHTGAHRKVLPL